MPQDSPVVIITGCSKGGIGFSLCEEFASKGCKVYATARRVETMEGFNNENIECLRLDVTDDANMQDVVKTVLEREGRIDILVNNAGIAYSGPLAEEPMTNVAAVFDTNTFGVLRAVKAVFPHMAARKSGTIVNVGSMVADIPTPWGGVYSASKAATASITDSLYMECAPFNISVVHLSPGGIRSDIGNKLLSALSLSPDSFYSGWMDSMIRRIELSQTSRSMPSEVFARRVVKAVLKPNPPRCMTLGAGSRVWAMFQWLPRGFVLWVLWHAIAGKPTLKAS